MKSTVALLLVSGLLYGAEASGQVSGGIIVNVEDGLRPRCVDVSAETVSMKVVSLQVKRTDTFWKESKTLGAKFDVVITNAAGVPFNFPRGTQISATSYTAEVGILPAQFPVLSKYSLHSSDAAYNSVGLKLYLIDITDKSDAAKTIQLFLKFTKDLPLPPNPYTSGVQLFGTFAEQVIDLNTANAEDKYPAAELHFDLAANAAQAAACPATALRTGIIAVIYSMSGKDDDILDIAQAQNRCFTFNSIASRVDMRPRKADGSCDAAATPKMIRNPLVALLVNTFSNAPGRVAPAAVLPTRTGFDVWKNSKNNIWLAAPEGALSTNLMATGLKVAESSKWHTGSVDAAVKFGDLSVNKVKAVGAALQSADDYKALSDSLKDVAAGDPSRVIEIQTAVALSRCALVGISARDCD